MKMVMKWLTHRRLNNFDGMWAVWFGVSVALGEWWIAAAIMVACPCISVLIEKITEENDNAEM